MLFRSVGPGSTINLGNTPGDTTVKVTVGTIPGGGERTAVTFRVKMPLSIEQDVNTISNQAKVGGSHFADISSDDPSTSAAGDPTVTTLRAAAKLAVTKAATLLIDADGDSAVSPGDTLRYLITVSNTGNRTATGVLITDVLDSNIALVDGSALASQGSITRADRQVDANLGSIGGGRSATVDLQVRVASSIAENVTQIANQAAASSTNAADTKSDDPATAAPGDATVTALHAAPKVTVTKTDAIQTDADRSGGATSGDTIAYTLVITNSGNQTATGVLLNDDLDPSVDLVSGSVHTSAGTVTSGTIPGERKVGVDIGTMSTGASVTLTFSVRIKGNLPSSVTTIANQASVAGTNVPKTLSNDPRVAGQGNPTKMTLGKPARVPTGIAPKPKPAKLGIAFTGASIAKPGQSVTLNVSVRNLSRNVAKGVIVRIIIPAQTSLTSLPKGARLVGGALILKFSGLRAGKPIQIPLHLRVSRTSRGAVRGVASALATNATPVGAGHRMTLPFESGVAPAVAG